MGAPGRPGGLPGSESMCIQDEDAGKSLAYVNFQSEDDYRRGDAFLNAMPADETPGSRSAVTKYNVAIRASA